MDALHSVHQFIEPASHGLRGKLVRHGVGDGGKFCTGGGGWPWLGVVPGAGAIGADRRVSEAVALGDKAAAVVELVAAAVGVLVGSGGGGGGGGDITVHVEYLARTLMQKQEGVAAEEQHRAMATSHRLSRVPLHLRNNNAKDYTPGFVAIGPLHSREDRRLRPAERLKVAYLNSLISRGHPDTAQHLAVIQGYIRVVAAREQEARAMYVGEDVAEIPPDEFIQMMVLEGCFII